MYVRHSSLVYTSRRLAVGVRLMMTFHTGLYGLDFPEGSVALPSSRTCRRVCEGNF